MVEGLVGGRLAMKFPGLAIAAISAIVVIAVVVDAFSHADVRAAVIRLGVVWAVIGGVVAIAVGLKS
jgi:hypothetical protein